MRITSPDGEILENINSITSQGEAIVKVAIPRPQLWWPNGYGGQILYQVEISLIRDDPSREGLLDRRRVQIGLRTIELRQKPDQWGRSFIFAVNGIPILCKGSLIG
jgi:beta-mannosidase